MLIGMGQTVDLTGAFAFDTTDTSAPTNIPCMDPTFSGPLQAGQSYCMTSASTPASSSTPVGNICFQSAFPWIGTGNTSGVCQPLSGASLALVALSSMFAVAFFIGGKK
jgi:hypothetical protein